MKYIPILFCLLFNISYGQDTAIINKSRKASIKIIAYNNKDTVTYGTGFFVSASNSIYILTCLHVIDKESVINNRTMHQILRWIKGVIYTGDTIDLSFLADNKIIPADFMKYDYAILTSNTLERKNIKSKITTLPISTKNAYVGENIYFTGYPFAFNMITTYGMISGLDTTNIYYQASSNEGNSGGALLDNSGNVIGIIDFKITGLQRKFKEYEKNLESDLKDGEAIRVTNEAGQNISHGNTDDILLLVQTIESTAYTNIGGAVKIRFAYKNLHL